MPITQTLEKTHTNPMCDLSIKRLFGNPYIISILAKETLPIYSPYTIQEIRDNFILDEINIGGIGVDQDEILKLDTEDKSINEGTICFDVLTLLKQNLYKGLFLNIEGQKDQNPGYDLLNRALYYLARLFSRQKNKIWFHSDYDNMLKVVSLWVCYDPNHAQTSSIQRYQLNCTEAVGTIDLDEEVLDKAEIIMIHIGENACHHENSLLRFLGILLSQQISVEEKMAYLKREYNIEDKELKGRVKSMCNISSVYFESGYKKGQEEQLQKSTFEHIQFIKEKLHITFEEAMDILEIPEEQRHNYRVN